MKREELKTPVYVIDEDALKRNLEILSGVEKRTGAKILLAQKAFSCYHFYPLIGEYISGTAASGLFEARLGKEEMGKENHVFSPAYDDDEIRELAKICDHIIFNSVAEKNKHISACKGVSVGLRINPEHSTQEHAIYDPCAVGSRMGVKSADIEPNDAITGIDGFHMHTLCEQNSDALAETVTAMRAKFGKWLKGLKWINLGGGHHITREGYDISLLERVIKGLQDDYGLNVYLEPGEAIALNAGELLTKVMTFVDNGKRIAILDASAACHMPDVLEMPYRPPLKDSHLSGEGKFDYVLASRTCLAGDTIGEYSFDAPLKEGDILSFQDMAIYTMVKNNTFNGMPLPSIAVKRGTNYEIIKQFGYEDFKCRL